ELRAVHEDMKMTAATGHLKGDLIHHAYPSLESLIDHANRYSSLGAGMVVENKNVGFSSVNLLPRPLVPFFYTSFFPFAILDGKEALLVLPSHAAYVSWKY